MLGLIKCVLLDVFPHLLVTSWWEGIRNIMVVVCSVAVSQGMENMDQLIST